MHRIDNGFAINLPVIALTRVVLGLEMPQIRQIVRQHASAREPLLTRLKRNCL